jgi:hypothetical protein
LRENSPLTGNPTEITERLAVFADAGVQRVYLQILDIADAAEVADHLGLFAAEVMPQFAARH